MEYENMTVAELKDLLRAAGLPVSGKKAELITRLQESSDIPESVEETESEIEESIDEIDDDDFEGEEFFEDEWDDFHTARQKPVLDDETKDALKTRSAQKKKQPKFRRQEWFRYKRLSRTGWKKPRGDDSSQRKNRKYRSPMVRVGYGKIADARGLHPSGFEEIIVETAGDLDGLNPERQAVRIAASVGNRKRASIHDRADDLGLRILNRRRFRRKGDLQ
ncbi:MAG TPA: 50S ribosomal protein L32e [Candidatus Thalassarchaeaceae archaeon]|jgi:large subunit ribosomal protein L32e|nr:50S ribosomal protein L32e [Candidatus Thalassarchaeaceae archaeon]HJO42744.1 50S ribosomal protein L32e [Candidatus Thalassarchaeaceae archaeon]|tara:strand:+ start:172 stop:831 length:660 start_codon:yes stop_codon:yes gene_type:complete